MNRILWLSTAGLLLAAAPAPAAVKGRLDVQLVALPVDTGQGLYDVIVQVRTVGTANPAQGDGGVADLQFSLVSTDAGRADAVESTPPNPSFSRAKFTWDPAISAAFNTVLPSRSDRGNDGDFDAYGATFSDSNNFTRTDLGTANWATVATLQFQLRDTNLPSHLAVIPEFPQYYDFVTGQGIGFRSTFASIYTAGFTIGPFSRPDPLTLFPEPAALAPACLALTTLARRRRRGIC